MQSSLKTTPKEKSWVEEGPEKNVKKSHSTTPYTEQNKTKQGLTDKWPQKKKGGIKEMDPSSKQASS